MTNSPEWWQKPRRVAVVIDNPSWVLPHGKSLVSEINGQGDRARLCRSHDDVTGGGIAFYLGCIKITPPGVLGRNHRNLVVHASDLPRGRGFSPLTWQIIGGIDDIPVCLLEAVDEVDAGNVVYRERIGYQGHELIEEMREMLGRRQIDLCLRFLAEPFPPPGEPQTGEISKFERRRPADSELDPHRTIAEQFNLLRTVDNDRYPAFFGLHGHRYKISITKYPSESP